jgi:uncharacterized protein YuzE
MNWVGVDRFGFDRIMKGVFMGSLMFDRAQMDGAVMRYFEGEDVLHLAIAEGPEADTIEISADVTAELNGAGEVIGVEILNASRYVKDNRILKLYL